MPFNHTIDYDDASHIYKIDGEVVPSVTQILDRVSPKPALTWWGMRVGLSAVIRLLQLEDRPLSAMVLQTYDADDHLSGNPVNGEYVVRGKGARAKKKTPLEALVIEHKLDTNNIRDTKANLGTLVHDAIETVGLTEQMPKLSDFAPEARGYLRAFAGFWLDQDPEMLEQEVIVASAEKKYAGRFDLVAGLSGDRCLVDFKTSGGLYPEYSEQLELYELAYEEMEIGDPFDRKVLVHLKPDGGYEVRDAASSRKTALAAIDLFHARAADKAALPKAWK